MPNFDGTGPLKWGRIIGRALGPCSRRDEVFRCKSCDAEPDSGKKRGWAD